MLNTSYEAAGWGTFLSLYLSTVILKYMVIYSLIMFADIWVYEILAMLYCLNNIKLTSDLKNLDN